MIRCLWVGATVWCCVVLPAVHGEEDLALDAVAEALATAMFEFQATPGTEDIVGNAIADMARDGIDEGDAAVRMNVLTKRSVKCILVSLAELDSAEGRDTSTFLEGVGRLIDEGKDPFSWLSLLPPDVAYRATEGAKVCAMSVAQELGVTPEVMGVE